MPSKVKKKRYNQRHLNPQNPDNAPSPCTTSTTTAIATAVRTKKSNSTAVETSPRNRNLAPSPVTAAVNNDNQLNPRRSDRTPPRSMNNSERREQGQATAAILRVIHDNDEEQPPSPRPSNEFNNNISASNLLIEARLVDEGNAQLANTGDLVQGQPSEEKEMRCRDAWTIKRMRRNIYLRAFVIGSHHFGHYSGLYLDSKRQ